jgi:transposase InsO family protein
VLHRPIEPGQYTSWLFGSRLRHAGLLGSMGKVASAYDNALMESFFGSMQIELLDRRTLDHPERARQRDLRMDRGVLQPDPTPLRPGLPRPKSSNAFTPPPEQRHDHHTVQFGRSGPN